MTSSVSENLADRNRDFSGMATEVDARRTIVEMCDPQKGITRTGKTVRKKGSRGGAAGQSGMERRLMPHRPSLRSQKARSTATGSRLESLLRPKTRKMADSGPLPGALQEFLLAFDPRREARSSKNSLGISGEIRMSAMIQHHVHVHQVR